MSILIKGMEMPMCCDDCPVFDDNGDYPTCILTGLSKGYNFPIFEKRMDNCPLIEVPTPQGRLIDADALRFEIEKYFAGLPIQGHYDMLKMVDEVPTIIEAEGDNPGNNKRDTFSK